MLAAGRRPGVQIAVRGAALLYLGTRASAPVAAGGAAVPRCGHADIGRLLCVLPVVYLRRVSALSQTAHAVLCLLVLVTAVMLVSVLPRLRVTNLQTAPLTQGNFRAAAKDQLTLYPEYLLPALWPEQDKRGRHALLRLAGYTLAFDVGMHLLLELFYGAGHAAAGRPRTRRRAVRGRFRFSIGWSGCNLFCGSWRSRSSWRCISMRWCGCWAGRARPRTAPAGLDRFPLYLGGIWLLCAVLRKLDLDAALPLRSTMTWGFVVLTWMGGAAACLMQKVKALPCFVCCRAALWLRTGAF